MEEDGRSEPKKISSRATGIKEHEETQAALQVYLIYNSCTRRFAVGSGT